MEILYSLVVLLASTVGAVSGIGGATNQPLFTCSSTWNAIVRTTTFAFQERIEISNDKI